MGNSLDELTGPVNADGNDVNVINKQLEVTVGAGTKVFEIAIWFVPVIIAFALGYLLTQSAIYGALIAIVGILPGLIFQAMKTNAHAYLRQLEQKIQADASQIDNYLAQRDQILQNVAGLLAKSIDLDKDVMKSVAAYRGGVSPTNDAVRNDTAQKLDNLLTSVNVAFEAYPQLRAQETIEDAMRQNSNLQKEITASMTLYNDSVRTWNRDIFAWPTKQIVAAKAGYTSRIPFTASAEMKAAARGTFF